MHAGDVASRGPCEKWAVCANFNRLSSELIVDLKTVYRGVRFDTYGYLQQNSQPQRDNR